MLALKALVPGTEAWLHQAVLVSIFTDARAFDSDAVAGNNRGGCWSDMFLPSDESLGSRLWILRRSTLDNDTLKSAQNMLRSALKWLLITYVDAIDIAVSRVGNSVMQFVITLKFQQREDMKMEVLYDV